MNLVDNHFIKVTHQIAEKVKFIDKLNFNKIKEFLVKSHTQIMLSE